MLITNVKPPYGWRYLKSGEKMTADARHLAYNHRLNRQEWVRSQVFHGSDIFLDDIYITKKSK